MPYTLSTYKHSIVITSFQDHLKDCEMREFAMQVAAHSKIHEVAPYCIIDISHLASPLEFLHGLIALTVQVDDQTYKLGDIVKLIPVTPDLAKLFSESCCPEHLELPVFMSLNIALNFVEDLLGWRPPDTRPLPDQTIFVNDDA